GRFPWSVGEGSIEAVLTGRAVFVEKIQHIGVDAQRHGLLDAGHRYRVFGSLDRLGRHRLEGLLGQGPGVRLTSRARCVPPSVSGPISRIVSRHIRIMTRCPAGCKGVAKITGKNLLESTTG